MNILAFKHISGKVDAKIRLPTISLDQFFFSFFLKQKKKERLNMRDLQKTQKTPRNCGSSPAIPKSAQKETNHACIIDCYEQLTTENWTIHIKMMILIFFFHKPKILIIIFSYYYIFL